MVVVVLVGAALRLLHLDQPIRYDEAVTYLEYVSLPLSEGLSTYDLPNNHLFHTLLAHLAVDAFGDSVAALRAPAWVAGTLVVPATYLVGRTLRDATTGLLAAALAAASPVLILFSANARGYSLVVLAFLAMVGAASVLARRWSLPAWAGFVAAAALGAWTIPVMLYPAVAAAAWWLAGAARGDRSFGAAAGEAVGAAAVAAVLAALLYLPVFRQAGVDAVVANRFVAPSPLPVFLSEVPGFLAGVVEEWAHGVPAWAWVPVAAGAVVEGAAWIAGSRPDRPRLFPVSVGAALVVLAASRRTPYARVWLFLLPAFLIFASGGLRRLAGRAADAAAERGLGPRWRALAGAGLPVVAAVVVGVAVWRGEAVTDWGLTGTLPAGERVAEFVAERWQPGDAVFARLPSDGPLKFYFRRRGLPEDVVNRPPRPGGCVFVVVNRRHGQAFADVVEGAGPGRPDQRLRAWDGTVVYGVPATPGGPGASDGDRGPCAAPRTGWRGRPRPDTFAAIGSVSGLRPG